MIFDKIFMIRGGEGTGLFNTDFNVKLIFAVIIFCIIIYDIKTNKRKDYLRVLSAGTIIWSSAEFVMQKFGIREFHQGYILGFPLPFIIQIILQGIVEGAGVTIFCILFVDNILNSKEKKKKIWILVFLFILKYMKEFFLYVDYINNIIIVTDVCKEIRIILFDLKKNLQKRIENEFFSSFIFRLKIIIV